MRPVFSLVLFLSIKALTYLGLISYSLYLWHFPIFAFARVKDNTPSEYDKFEWIALTFVLSIITYFCVEKFFKNKIAITKNRLIFFLSSILFIRLVFLRKDMPASDNLG